MVELLKKVFNINKDFNCIEYKDKYVFSNDEVGIDIFKDKKYYYKDKKEVNVWEREKFGIKVINNMGYGFYDYRN